MAIKAPRGTRDVLPGNHTNGTMLRICSENMQPVRYREIRTPVFENTELFQRGVGRPPMLFKRKCTPLRTGEEGA